MSAPHVVLVDSTLAGLLAFQTARRMGWHVSFVEPLDSSFLALSTSDPSRVRPHLAHLHDHLRIPTLGGGLLEQSLHELARRHGPVHALVTTSEAAILPVARAAESLGLPGPGLAALERAVYKDRCRALLRAAGLRSPDFEVMAEHDLVAGHPKRIAAPLVVKPTRGFGKQYSAVCHTEEAFHRHVIRLKATRGQADPMIDRIVNNDHILEAYLPGSLHSCEVVVVDGETRLFATTTRYRAEHDELLEVAYSMPSDLPPEHHRAIEAYVSEVFRAIDLRFGLYHVELILGTQGPCLVEINGRMMGGVGPQAYALVSGNDAFEWLLRLHAGEQIAPGMSGITRAATVVLVGASSPGTVSTHFSQGRLDALLQRHGIHFCTLKLAPGTAVRRFDGNLSVLGHAIVPGTCVADSQARGLQFLNELDGLLGVTTAKFRLG